MKVKISVGLPVLLPSQQTEMRKVNYSLRNRIYVFTRATVAVVFPKKLTKYFATENLAYMTFVIIMVLMKTSRF